MQLAEVNIAQLIAPLESDEIFEFREFIGAVNVLAEAQSGFVWRLKDEEGSGATQVAHPFEGDNVIVNMSVWTDVGSLRHFMYTTAHSYFLQHRKRWFMRMEKPHLAMWWIEDGHRPTLQEAKERLNLIETLGSTAQAFTLTHFYEADGTASQTVGK